MKTRLTLLISFLAMFFMVQAQDQVPGTIRNNSENNQINFPEENGLTELYSVTGNYYLSVDGAGSNSNYTVDVNKPSNDAVVHKAILMAATYDGTIPNGCVTLNGTGLNWEGSIVNALGGSNYHVDVTSVVGPVMDVAAPGITSFDVTECNTFTTDGIALLVIFSDPNASEETIVILFGAQAFDGDTFSIALAESINPDDPNALLDMGLGISFSYQFGGSQQYSIIDVNGERLTTSSGGEDDGASANGALMTVGGLGDSNDNPADPFATPTNPLSDDEFYSILPFIDINTTEISVFTSNPSNDDNIFLAYFEISGAAIIGEGILLSQDTDEPEVGTDHTVKALIQDDQGNPVEGKTVDFEVISGPNAGTMYSEVTNADGEAFFTYSSAVEGMDEVQACFENSQGATQCSNVLMVNWMVPQAENIVLTQVVNTLPVGNMHTVTATLDDEMGDPIVGRQVDFEVISGPHAGTTYSESTDDNGQAFFSYQGTSVGVDEIQACFENIDMETQCSNILTFQWTSGQGGFENCIPEGWSIISSPYEPVDPAFPAIFADLVNNEQVVILLNEEGFWWPSQNINTLGDWNSSQAYKIKLTEEGCVQFGEVPVMDLDFDFGAGIDYLPVPVDQPVAADEIFSQLGESLLYAFDLYEGLVYWPAGGIFTLETLVPGKGYVMNLSDPGSVDFSMVAKSSINQNVQVPVIENAPWTVNKTDVAHLISLRASALNIFEKGDIVAAFNEVGVCVGMASYQGNVGNLALVAYGDDISTETIDGLTENEIISFKAFDVSENSIVDLEATFDTSLPNTRYFVEYGASAVNEFKAGALSVEENPVMEMNLYPNPATDVVNIQAMDADAVITLTNAQGQVVLSASAKAGETVTLDVSTISRGVYFLKAQSEGNTAVSKIFVK